MLSYIAAFIFGGMWGFIVCAFFVGCNSRHWNEDWGEAEYWKKYNEKKRKMKGDKCD